jgi:hypothetical protein
VLVFFWAIAGGIFVLWWLLIHLLPLRVRLFCARHPVILAALHIPVMLFFANIGGDGMIFASASLIGGLAGQLYLSLWGTRRGLTFFGHKTINYQPIPKKQRIKLRNRIDLAVTNKLLGL